MSSRGAAHVSEDGRYRYWLSRMWGEPNEPMAHFIMLNPSTADAQRDDPTIRRCVGFAKALGCGGLFVLNLYAYRTTYPADLWKAKDPVGPENDRWIATLLQLADENEPIIAAWGANAKADRVGEVRALPGMARLTALAFTKGGHPRHPLYLPADARPVPFGG